MNRYKNILYIVMPEMFKILMPHPDYLSPKRINDFENAIKKKKEPFHLKLYENQRESGLASMPLGIELFKTTI